MKKKITKIVLIPIKRIMIVFFIFLVLALSSPAQDEISPEPFQEQPEQVTYDDFLQNPTYENYQSLSPEDQARYYENSANVGLRPQIDAFYFDKQENIGKNPESDKTFFSGNYPGGNSRQNFLDHTESAAAYLQKTYRTAYTISDLAAEFFFDPDTGTLQNGVKAIFFADYQDDPAIQEIITLKDGFKIIRTRDEITEDISITGDAHQDIRYQENKLTFVDLAGREQTFTFEAAESTDISFKFQDDSSFEVTGPVSGAIVVSGKLVQFRNYGGTLVLQANGDIKTDNAEVVTSNFYGDGSFEKKGTIVTAQDHSFLIRDGERGVVRDGRTRIIDRTTSVGVVTQGQTGENRVTIHLDELSDRSDFAAPSPAVVEEAVDAERARQEARQLRPAAGDLGKNAEVYISRDEQTQDVIVTSKGSVDVGFYTVGDRGGAVLKEGTPHFLGENGKSELDMRVGQHSVVNVRGKGTYADGQYSTLRAHEDGTSLKITRPGRDLQDALVVDCFACAAGTTALEMSKSIISAQQTALAAVFQKDAELTFDVSVTVTDDGLRYAPRLDNLGRLAEEQTKGGTLIFGRDLLMKIPCGENECNFALTRDPDTNSIQGFFEQFDPATKQTTAPTPIDFSAGNVLGEEVVVTSEKNVESINKLVELIENKQFAQLSEAKLEFDDDPALRKLIRAEIGIDIALLDNVPYRQKVGDALEQRQKAVQQLDAGEIIIVDPAQPLLERDLSKIYIDSNGNPLSPEDAQKIQRLRKTQTAQFYLYTAGRANLAKADIAEAEALRDAGGISKAEFEERKKTQNKIISQMQQLRKDVAVEIEERKTLMDINSGIMPIGFEDSSAQVQELGNKRTREVRELREVENNLAIAQARINEIKESGVLEQENKFLQEDARVELENLERSIPALAEGAWQRKKNLASLDTEILLIAGTYAADRPDAAAELALQGGLPEVALDSSNALEKIAPGKSAELQTEAAYASGVQEIAEQEISKQALSDYQREKVRFLLKQGDLATAVLTLQEMDPSIGGNAEENQKLAEELVWKELVDRADFEYNDRKDVAYHKHQQSLEERSGVGGFFTYFGRQISPINVYYLVTEGESKVIDTYDELDRNSIRRLSESEDQARALLVTLQALKEEGLTPQEAMERIRTLQIASPQARDAIAGETSTTFFHNLRNEMRGQYQTKDDIAMQAMEEVEKQITFNNGKVAPVEAQLRAITNEFPGTAASEQASRRLRELYRVEDLTFYNVLPTEALDTYGDAAMEVADITDVIPVGALLKVAKLAKGTKVAKVGSKLTTAVELSKWNSRIHFTSEARALEKVAGQARSELRLALKTGDTELIAAATKNLDEIKTAQQGLELSGSKLGNWWQNTALGKKRGITTAENVAYEGQRQAVKLLRDNIAEVGIKNVDQNLISGVQQANKVVEEATTFAARSNAVIDYTNEKVTPPTTLDSSVAKVDAFNSELVSQTHSIPKPVADDVVDNIDALDNAGAQLGPTLRYDPATLPSELQPRAAAVEKALDDLQVSPEEVARRAQQEAAAEAEFAASEFATSQRISGEARQQAVGSSADVLPEVHSSISTDLPAPRKRATAPGGPTEFTPPETIESGFNDAVSGTSRAVHSPEVPSRFLKQKQQFLAQPFDEDALADGVASAFIQYQKTGEFSPELNLLLSRLHGEPSEAAVGRVADKITSALQREGGPQLADTFQAYKDVVFGKGRFSVEYKPVYEIAGVTDEIRRYDLEHPLVFQVSDLNERVLKRRNLLAAHGVEEAKGGMRNMLNIMLEGEVRFGQTGPLAKGNPQFFAGDHGPYYVVLDESKRVFRKADDPLFRYSPTTFPEDAHVAYIIPLEQDRELVSRALDEAVNKNLITAAERDAILSKTITYDDYLRLPDEALKGPQQLAAELKLQKEVPLVEDLVLATERPRFTRTEIPDVTVTPIAGQAPPPGRQQIPLDELTESTRKFLQENGFTGEVVRPRVEESKLLLDSEQKNIISIYGKKNTLQDLHLLQTTQFRTEDGRWFYLKPGLDDTIVPEKLAGISDTVRRHKGAETVLRQHFGLENIIPETRILKTPEGMTVVASPRIDDYQSIGKGGVKFNLEKFIHENSLSAADAAQLHDEVRFHATFNAWSSTTDVELGVRQGTDGKWHVTRIDDEFTFTGMQVGDRKRYTLINPLEEIGPKWYAKGTDLIYCGECSRVEFYIEGLFHEQRFKQRFGKHIAAFQQLSTSPELRVYLGRAGYSRDEIDDLIRQIQETDLEQRLRELIDADGFGVLVQDGRVLSEEKFIEEFGEVPVAGVDPQIVASNKQVLGTVASDPRIENALKNLPVTINCQSNFVGRAALGSCPTLVEIDNLDNLKEVDRINDVLTETGNTPIEVIIKGENVVNLERYRQNAQFIKDSKNELDNLLSQIITPTVRRNQIEPQIEDLRSLEEIAGDTYGTADYRYREIKLNRIALDSKYDDPVINPYVEIRPEHRAIATSFLPTHKPADIDTLITIIGAGGFKSPKSMGTAVLEERVLRGQEDSIFLSAGAPYSHLQVSKDPLGRHNKPLVVFKHEEIYQNPTFKSTPRDSFGYDNLAEINEHTLNSEELDRYLVLLAANDKIAPEVADFTLRPGRDAEFGTFFPEITIERQIDLDAINSIILTEKDRGKLLSTLRQSSDFQQLVGKKLKSDLEVQKALQESFGITLITPVENLNVDQMYWQTIGQAVPIYE